MPISYGDKVDKRIIEGSELEGDCFVWKRALNANGYGHFTLTTSEGVKHVRLHRYVWELENGPIPPGMQVDHKCYNRACWNTDHLQLVTPKQNSENRNPENRYRGVHWRKDIGKWQARVKHHGKSYHCGYFVDIEEAAAAAKELRNRLYTNSLGDAA